MRAARGRRGMAMNILHYCLDKFDAWNLGPRNHKHPVIEKIIDYFVVCCVLPVVYTVVLAGGVFVVRVVLSILSALGPTIN
jgi:hypothetical protein